ncbi:hypothetical protein GCM10010988_13940 [Cnuibacter physcomitrellae]|nr:hypothetical protein GCM10010988_13940 [Cnuibacter physcomitrellae]
MWTAAGVAALVMAAMLAAGASARADDGGAEEDGSALSGRLQYIAELPDGGDVAEQIAAASDVLGTVADGPGSIAESGGRLSVTVTFATRPDAAAFDALRAYGEVTAASELFSMATVRVAPADLEALASVPGVSSVREDIVPRTTGSWPAAAATPAAATGSWPAAAATPAAAAATTSAATTSAAAPAADADDCRSIPANLLAPLNVEGARDAFGVDGMGVTVGIISDSYARLPDAATQIAGSVAHGLLPGAGNPCGYETPVEVLRESTLRSGSDEGRAMAQLVHQIAPGARLMFATAGAGQLEYSESITALTDAGADVIVDDVLSNEPWFQDGPISYQVQQVTDRGIPYLAAAGNFSSIGARGYPSAGYSISGWETAAYRPAECPQAVQDEFRTQGVTAEISCMDFDPGTGVDTLDQMVSNAGPTPSSRPTTYALQWAEPFGAATTDIRFGLIEPNGNVATTLAPAPGIPSQEMAVPMVSGDYQYFIARIGSGDSTPRIKTWFYGPDTVAVEYFRSAGDDVVGHTLSAHEGAPQTIAVAAVSAQDTSTPETFTSAGPASYWFDWDPTVSPIATPRTTPIVTEGPVIAGVDRGYTDFFGGEISTGLYSFAGTSAAAPSAAAVVALGLQRNPDATPAQVRSALSSTASPLPSISPVSLTPEQVAGAGLIDAQAFVGALAPAPQPVPVPVPVPASVPTAQSPQLAATGASEVPFLALIALGVASLGLGVVVRRRGKGRHS